jgi:hypothetical protein
MSFANAASERSWHSHPFRQSCQWILQPGNPSNGFKFLGVPSMRASRPLSKGLSGYLSLFGDD